MGDMNVVSPPSVTDIYSTRMVRSLRESRGRWEVPPDQVRMDSLGVSVLMGMGGPRRCSVHQDHAIPYFPSGDPRGQGY